MNEKVRKKVLREELKKRNGGKSTVTAKYIPKYPESAEREYIRLTNAYMSIEREILLAHIPELKRIIAEGTKGFNMDSSKENDQKRRLARFEMLDNTLVRIKILFDTIRRELDAAFGLFDLAGRLNKLANLNSRFATKEWKKVISKTLGIDLLEDYYYGDFYKELLEEWVTDNVDLIKTVPHNSLKKMKEIVYSGYMNGQTTTNIVNEIQREYGMSKRHAKFIARDQTAKLNAKITQKQQRDAGSTEYEWFSVRDERTRRGDKMAKGAIDPMGNNHLRLAGKVFSWDEPPLVDRKRGRRCHPGEDYQCRCRAISVLDIDNLDIPM